MLLLRGATHNPFLNDLRHLVSIHAPLARSNLTRKAVDANGKVSIHAPLARSNSACRKDPYGQPFQYMLLLRGATSIPIWSEAIGKRFNTCSSCEEQQADCAHTDFVGGFNTCSSCEEQLYRFSWNFKLLVVSIHAPLARSNLYDKKNLYLA